MTKKKTIMPNIKTMKDEKITFFLQAPKRDNGSDMDHMGEINTLKEKIISLEKQISAKNRELIAKDQVDNMII